MAKVCDIITTTNDKPCMGLWSVVVGANKISEKREKRGKRGKRGEKRGKEGKREKGKGRGRIRITF